MDSLPSSSCSSLNTTAAEGQYSTPLTLSQGVGLPTMPIMLSVSLAEKDKGNSKMVSGTLPPVLQLIRQSGLQTLSPILPKPPTTVNPLATPILDFPGTSSALTHAGTTLTDTTHKLLTRPTFDLSPFLKLPNQHELVSTQNPMSLTDTNSLHNLANAVLESTNSQILASAETLTSSSGQENILGQTNVNPSPALLSSQSVGLQNMSVHDAITVHLCSGEFSRSDLGPHLEALVSNAAFIPSQCPGQYVTNQTSQVTSHQPDHTAVHGQHAGNTMMSVGDHCQLTSDLQNSALQSDIQSHMMCTTTGHQSDSAHLSTQHQDPKHMTAVQLANTHQEASPMVTGQLTNGHQESSQMSHLQDPSLVQQKGADQVAIGNEMTVVGYNPQDYLNMQTNLATAYLPLPQDQTNQDPSSVVASLASQIEAISSSINNPSGLLQIPTAVSNSVPASLIDMVLKLAGKRDLQDSEQSVSDATMVSSGLAIPQVFVSFCVGCNTRMKTEPCQVHETGQKHIEDNPILSRARASLPACLYLSNSVASSKAANITTGVWAKQVIEANIRFGPLIGKVTTLPPGDIKMGSIPEFRVMYSDKVELYSLEDEEESNWLRFVQIARTEAVQNIVVTQLGCKVYFYTTCEIYPGQELLFWFSKDYAIFLGIPPSPEAKKIKDCMICHNVYLGRKSLQAHQKLEHVQEMKQKWMCNICEQGFCTSTKLNDHMNIHMGIKPHTCHVCGKRFTDQSNLRTHVQTHSNIKKFVCSRCSRSFRQKVHLQTHMLTHTGEKNLQCSYCVKKFARESDRKQHQYQHTKEKVYQCTECLKVFYKLQNYKRHKLMHSGEKNHACPKCQKRFYTKYHLQRHSKTCKGAKTEIYLNKHEKNLNLEEMANELSAGPSASRSNINSIAK